MSNSETLSLKQLSDVFGALSHPYRLGIFLRLSCCPDNLDDDGSNGQVCACVGTLGKDLDISPSTVSHHLKELHRAGVIEMDRQGQKILCSIRPGVVRAVADFFAERACAANT